MRRFWPQSLASRITLLLIGGLTLLHVGSVAVHERALHGAQDGARLALVANRILAARAAVDVLPEAARDAAAHNMSSNGMEFHWDRAPPSSARAVIPEALSELAALLGPDAMLAWDTDAAPGHRAIGAIPVASGGWIVFSSGWLGTAVHGIDVGSLTSMVAMALGIALASIVVIRWITQPLGRLASAADEIGRDLRARPLPITGPLEVRRAAAAFNAMQDRIARLVEDRTEALAAMSHDLRTPLARLRLRASFLPEDEAREKMDADMTEMETLIRRTLDYLREGRDAEPVQPADLAAILQTLASDATDAGHDVAYDGPSKAILPLRRLAAKRAFSNLVENAVLHGKGAVRLTIRNEETRLVAEIIDHGAGIAATDRARALAPFMQLDPSRGAAGTGLGLAIAQRFAEASQGTLELGAAPSGGLLVRLALAKPAA